VLVALSTSGRSPNVLAATEAGNRRGMVTWAMTGIGPNPLATVASGAVCVDAARTATVQEVHQVLVHVLCESFDEALLTDANWAALLGAVR
jgi:D-sedoheptulose 7-phosphate isomerase